MTLEHATPEQMFASQDTNDPLPNAISAVKALQIASAEGQMIYQITQDNMSTVLPNIHHNQDTMYEIRASLNAGKEVITHASSVSVPGWGYIIVDAETGAGAYKILGGGNGGFKKLDKLSIFLKSILNGGPLTKVVNSRIGIILNLLDVIGILMDCWSNAATLSDYVKVLSGYVAIAALFSIYTAGVLFLSGTGLFGLLGVLLMAEAMTPFVEGIKRATCEN